MNIECANLICCSLHCKKVYSHKTLTTSCWETFLTAIFYFPKTENLNFNNIFKTYWIRKKKFVNNKKRGDYMSLINIQNLTFSYDNSDKKIFDNVSFQIDTDWKIGLVGRNGRGKTTFLNLLLNKLEYTGKISSNVKFTYFPFEIENQNQLAYDIVTNICPNAEDWEIIREFSYLQLDYDTLYSNYSNLSNGEKTKVLLAALFLKENNFLLIDEPTNHLDSTGRKIVAEYLGKKKGFILVSHDRYFLDVCTDHIISINKCDIDITQGNFSVWLDNFNKQQAFENAQNEQLKKEIDRLSKAAKQTSNWADKVESSKYGGGPVDRGFIGHKAAKMMKRSKATENRQRRAIEQKSELLHNTERMDSLKLQPLKYRNEQLILISNVVIKYQDKTICKPIDFFLKDGDRILLDGINGCGKSSLLKLIVGEQIEFDGKINIPEDLVISYLPQTFDNLCGSISDFSKISKIDEPLFRAILSKMGFDKNDFLGDISKLSLGQKKKILIAKSLSEKAHLYIWDEPLNYLDIFARMQIEKLLQEYHPNMIFVEHDIAFQNCIANKVQIIEKYDG